MNVQDVNQKQKESCNIFNFFIINAVMICKVKSRCFINNNDNNHYQILN